MEMWISNLTVWPEQTDKLQTIQRTSNGSLWTSRPPSPGLHRHTVLYSLFCTHGESPHIQNHTVNGNNVTGSVCWTIVITTCDTLTHPYIETYSMRVSSSGISTTGLKSPNASNWRSLIVTWPTAWLWWTGRTTISWLHPASMKITVTHVGQGYCWTAAIGPIPW